MTQSIRSKTIAISTASVVVALALAEAAKEIKSQADDLAQVVAVFKLD